MNGILHPSRIDYVLYHLSFHITDFEGIRHLFRYTASSESGIIRFNLSPEPFSTEAVKWIEGIPVLFPLGKENAFFSMHNENLIFHHDILKSAFYLLSGYQEYVAGEKDALGRYPYESSLQCKLDIIHKPVVNYYFEIIMQGLARFCHRHSIPFHKKHIFDTPVAMLTHDIDRIKTYSFPETVFRLKQLAGFSRRSYSLLWHFWLALKYVVGFPFQYFVNPHWDVKNIIKLEKAFQYRSVFYLLRNERKHYDSYYQYDDPKIRNLIQYIHAEGCETGLHGTYNSARDFRSLRKSFELLSEQVPLPVMGNRQHRLQYEHPKTLIYQEMVGITYDTTLGFAAHEGFRHAYCLPFKLYDFENERRIEVWEIPLTVMDGTLFDYRKLSLTRAEQSVDSLLEEVKRFNGICTILWHNGYGIDKPQKHVRNFYKKLLALLQENNMKAMTGREIIKHIES